MSAVEAEPAAIERIRLHRVSRTFGIASVRLAGVHLLGLKIEERPDGSLLVKPPEQQDRQGRRWACYALQPECRASIEAELAVLWARS